jgi:uncharacterized membrane protein YphA (DoxX/SURF4 family)
MIKALLANDYLVLVARIVLGFLFVVVSIEKIRNPNAFAISIENYRIVPPLVAMLLATILPWMELLCGLSVLCGVFVRGGSLLLAVLLVVFTAAVASALVRGLDISCGCFTQDPEAERIGWRKVGENLGLLAVTVFLLCSTSDRLSLVSLRRWIISFRR